MIHLIITTIIWSFSFSIIGNYLSPQINSWTLAFFRSLIAFIFFLPWYRKDISYKYLIRITSIGALQIGLMYVFYLTAFNYTTVQRILLFTITTPFYVVLISNLFERKFKLPVFLLSILFPECWLVFQRMNIWSTLCFCTDQNLFIKIT